MLPGPPRIDPIAPTLKEATLEEAVRHAIHAHTPFWHAGPSGHWHGWACREATEACRGAVGPEPTREDIDCHRAAMVLAVMTAASTRKQVRSKAELDDLPIDTVIDCGGGYLWTKTDFGHHHGKHNATGWVSFHYCGAQEPLSSEHLWGHQMACTDVGPCRLDEHPHQILIHWLPRVMTPENDPSRAQIRTNHQSHPTEWKSR